jgi:hypothetical protein
MPFGAGLVVALIVLAALLGCDVEDDLLFVVLSGFDFCVLSEVADEDNCVDYELVWFRPARFRDAATGGRPTLTLVANSWGTELESCEVGAARLGNRRSVCPG